MIIEKAELLGANRGVDEIDLVHTDDRTGATALDRDQVSIDQVRPERRGLDGRDDDHDVDVGGDGSIQSTIQRIKNQRKQRFATLKKRRTS